MTLAATPHADDDQSRPRSTAELENEIGRTRRRIGLTLDALAQQAAPRRLLQKGIAMASRFVDVERRDRPDAEPGFRPDPLALGLIGAGIAWLVAENADRRRRPTASNAVGTPMADGELPECQASVTDFVTAAKPCHDEGERAAHPVALGIAANPLLVGLIGLIVGAAVAALLPSSRREQEAIAQTREDLWQKAEALGHRAAVRIRDLGRGATPTPSAE
jgi:Protein of unknown function (DUF3618)